MMKMFLVAVSLLCLCGILFCFWAYATGNFPMSKTTPPLPVVARVEQSTMGETFLECSPCAEQMALLLDLMETEWEGDLMAFLEPLATPEETAAQRWLWLSSEQAGQAKKPDKSRLELKRLRAPDASLTMFWMGLRPQRRSLSKTYGQTPDDTP